MAARSLSSSKHFVPVEGGILLTVHREDPVLLSRTGVGEGRSIFVCRKQGTLKAVDLRRGTVQNDKFSPSFAAFRVTSDDFGYEKSFIDL